MNRAAQRPAGTPSAWPRKPDGHESVNFSRDSLGRKHWGQAPRDYVALQPYRSGRSLRDSLCIPRRGIRLRRTTARHASGSPGPPHTADIGTHLTLWLHRGLSSAFTRQLERDFSERVGSGVYLALLAWADVIGRGWLKHAVRGPVADARATDDGVDESDRVVVVRNALCCQ